MFGRKSLLFEAGVIDGGLIHPHYIFIFKIPFSKYFPRKPKSRFQNFFIIFVIRPVIYFFITILQVFGDIPPYRLDANGDLELDVNFLLNGSQAYIFVQFFII